MRQREIDMIIEAQVEEVTALAEPMPEELIPGIVTDEDITAMIDDYEPDDLPMSTADPADEPEDIMAAISELIWICSSGDPFGPCVARPQRQGVTA